jgi:hypothetical protein
MLNMIVMIASTIQTIRVLAPIAIALYFPGHPLLNLSEKPPFNRQLRCVEAPDYARIISGKPLEMRRFGVLRLDVIIDTAPGLLQRLAGR